MTFHLSRTTLSVLEFRGASQSYCEERIKNQRFYQRGTRVFLPILDLLDQEIQLPLNREMVQKRILLTSCLVEGSGFQQKKLLSLKGEAHQIK